MVLAALALALAAAAAESTSASVQSAVSLTAAEPCQQLLTGHLASRWPYCLECGTDKTTRLSKEGVIMNHGVREAQLGDGIVLARTTSWGEQIDLSVSVPPGTRYVARIVGGGSFVSFNTSRLKHTVNCSAQLYSLCACNGWHTTAHTPAGAQLTLPIVRVRLCVCSGTGRRLRPSETCRHDACKLCGHRCVGREFQRRCVPEHPLQRSRRASVRRHHLSQDR
jgi:hypothetical protein